MPKFFFKANNDVLSHCRCENPPAQSSGQLDCPWCGCGWMIPCAICGRSFIFAQVRETEISLVEFGRREIEARQLRDISDEQVADWADGMADMLEGFEVGDIVVHLDGCYFKMDETDIAFDGLFAAHSLARLPHAEALADPLHLRRMLGDPRYWLDRELPARDCG